MHAITPPNRQNIKEEEETINETGRSRWSSRVAKKTQKEMAGAKVAVMAFFLAAMVIMASMPAQVAAHDCVKDCIKGCFTGNDYASCREICMVECAQKLQAKFPISPPQAAATGT